MAVNTKKVDGRRALRLETVEDIRNEAKRLASTEVKTLGNWNVAQILEHLTKSMRLMRANDVDFKPNFFLKFMMKFMKNKFLNKGLPAGIQPDEKIFSLVAPSSDKETPVALEELAAFEADHDFGPHPLLGKMTPQDHHNFNCRHCELHMSFVVDA